MRQHVAIFQVLKINITVGKDHQTIKLNSKSNFPAIQYIATYFCNHFKCSYESGIAMYYAHTCILHHNYIAYITFIKISRNTLNHDE